MDNCDSVVMMRKWGGEGYKDHHIDFVVRYTWLSDYQNAKHCLIDIDYPRNILLKTQLELCGSVCQ